MPQSAKVLLVLCRLYLPVAYIIRLFCFVSIATLPRSYLSDGGWPVKTSAESQACNYQPSVNSFCSLHELRRRSQLLRALQLPKLRQRRCRSIAHQSLSSVPGGEEPDVLHPWHDAQTFLCKERSQLEERQQLSHVIRPIRDIAAQKQAEAQLGGISRCISGRFAEPQAGKRPTLALRDGLPLLCKKLCCSVCELVKMIPK